MESRLSELSTADFARLVLSSVESRSLSGLDFSHSASACCLREHDAAQQRRDIVRSAVRLVTHRVWRLGELLQKKRSSDYIQADISKIFGGGTWYRPFLAYQGGGIHI